MDIKVQKKSNFSKSLEVEEISVIRIREQFRDEYWIKRDPIYEERLLWRAQTFRHLAHILPKKSILELGCGSGLLTRKLHSVTRGENPITAVTFVHDNQRPEGLPTNVEFHQSANFPGFLKEKQFDFVIGMDIFDKRNCTGLLSNIYDLLKPGGQAFFYESNPQNLFHKVKNFIHNYLGNKDPRQLLSRSELSDLFHKIGFVNTLLLFNDFMYPPLTRSLIWLLRNLSIIMENTPGVKTQAGSILVCAQKPPPIINLPEVSLCDHQELYNAVSFIIPCHNEEKNIDPLINNILNLFGKYVYEIILVEDNSQDSTSEVIQRLAKEISIIKPVFRSPPSGMGRALADGLHVATGKYVMSMDCDFQHLVPELRDLFDVLLEEYDVVIGSRFSRHSVLLNYPLKKLILNRGFHLLAQIMFHRGFRDLTNNLKLMRREVIDKLRLTQSGFAVNAETGLQPLLMGYSFKEVPISWINRTTEMGSSSFQLTQAGIGYIQVLLSLWLKNLFGFISKKAQD